MLKVGTKFTRVCASDVNMFKWNASWHIGSLGRTSKLLGNQTVTGSYEWSEIGIYSCITQNALWLENVSKWVFGVFRVYFVTLYSSNFKTGSPPPHVTTSS